MTATQLLFITRREQELANLSQVENALATAAEEATAAVKGRFQLQIAECRRQITEDAHDLATLRRTLDTSVQPVLDEAFAYLQAVLYRKARLDGGAGAIAQWMADDIAARAGIDRKVLIAYGKAELIVHTFSMIRMRFQDTTVWRLPVLAHELGHHVAHHLRDVNFAELKKFPALKLLQNKANTSADHSRLHELFADVFATYALGAAYPLCAIVHQAKPGQGLDDHSDTHPSWPVRVHTMIAALRAMDGAFKIKAKNLVVPLWSSLAQTPEVPAVIAERATEMVALLTRHTPERLRFDIEGPVHQLYTRMPEPNAGEAPPGTTISHVLEAAWQWRVKNLDADPGLFQVASDNAKRWCEATMR